MNIKHYLLVVVTLLIGLGFGSARAEAYVGEDAPTKAEVEAMKAVQNRLRKDVDYLSSRNKKAERRISELEGERARLDCRIDSLQRECSNLLEGRKAVMDSIGLTNGKVRETEEKISSRTWWGACGIVALLAAIGAVVWAFRSKYRRGSQSIDDVREAQSSLKEAQERISKAQEKMQEEVIRLDNKLVEILGNQPVAASQTAPDGKVDHSLTLKVADEIARIELNMSRMDPSVKGYKQLAKAVERIKDNFKANGYEIVDMLGKPYNDGMKVTANFVADESVEEGKQIITGITKPQVNYNGQMIQAAQITVSQNI